MRGVRDGRAIATASSFMRTLDDRDKEEELHIRLKTKGARTSSPHRAGELWLGAG